MLGGIAAKIFGSKYERDIKRIMPIVHRINELYEEYQSLSDDQLRAKTDEFKARIKERTEDIEARLEDLKDDFKKAPSPEEKEDLADRIREAEEELKSETARALDEILPEAFAAVKEVCRRLRGRSWEVCGQRIVWGAIDWETGDLLDMIPFDVQLIGAVVLHQGKIAEMATGEGKTLVATMPLYLNALTGRGAHLVTPNDYLARRDASWMGPIYDFLGLSVGVIQDKRIDSGPDSFLLVKKDDDYALEPVPRQEAYLADITYGNNDEFGFDYLRDNMATRVEDLVQRGYNYAIVDEADFVLIDEARTPHIMSGPVPESTQRYREMKPLVQKLVRSQTKLVNRLVAEAEEILRNDGDEFEAGIKLLQAQRGAPKNRRLMKLQQEEGIKKLISRVEAIFMRDKRMGELDEELYYSIDEKGNVTDLTEKGRSSLSPEEQDMFVLPDLSENLQRIEEDESLSDEEKAKKQDEAYREYALKSERIHNASQLLKAYSLFERDVEYVIQDGRVVIVDEFTGRLQPGRRFSDGLHQALEAKEDVKIEQETQTVATITLQNYFRLYDKLAGMTGTAETEASEFFDIYKLDVVVIPTNEPVRRIDYDDYIYKTRREKYNAIIDEIVRLHKKKLPVLVGTVSVEVSETLSRLLKRRGIQHSVLNAKYHQQEAEIVAQAGQPGAVTIATNMAGRGTDIKLGTGVVRHPYCALVMDEAKGIEPCPYIDQLNCREDVPCGLHIIGTERHEARRIDRQLRGRCGRQGDPGASRFYLSLEDDLMRLFGSERIAAVMDKLGVEEGEMIRHSLVTKSIERAQKRVEERNFDWRKHVLEYDDVMNQQREVVYDRRRDALEKEDVRDQIEEMIDDVIDSLIEQYTDEKTYPEEWDLKGLTMELRNIFLVGLPLDDNDISGFTQNELKARIREAVDRAYKRREDMIGSEQLRSAEKMVLLGVIDEKWKEHLYEMDQLKEGIGLRGYGQRDPLIEYKKEGFQMFVEKLEEINREVLKFLFRAPIRERVEHMRRRDEQLEPVHRDAAGMGFTGVAEPEESLVGIAENPATPGPSDEPSGSRRPVRTGQKVGRNAPCPCGSGKKYKKCCGRVA